MIQESRSIIFTEDELIQALVPLLDAKEISSSEPPIKVESSFDKEGEVSVAYFPADGSEAVSFNSREVGAAVLNHCIELGIPLPRGSYKELTLRGDDIALIVRLETGLGSEE
ncbi:hypothetical protein [Kordiimonas sp. SCSIO 12610]|uniref:hypothetical protein n=1 Tax=Kordiimonas sp. SCSIO 12610 TaxID=2829597 RepID=UPI00210C1171|nr:hypothetical protein [Kordiimonas sp. SCSIO 12610]UTW55378.1 hypothetical protein KFF44_00350 [Kordiimonas sp. SCSIO 12610]